MSLVIAGEAAAAPAPHRVRPASPSDARAITAIHNTGIASGSATLDAGLHAVADTVDRIAGLTPPYALLVATADDDVVGWAATFPYSPRAAYRHVAEFSVYVDPRHAGQGHGRRLVRELLSVSADAGLRKIVGRVLAGNTASLALCAGAGFRVVGTHHRHGQVAGLWHDVVLLEALVDAPTAD